MEPQNLRWARVPRSLNPSLRTEPLREILPGGTKSDTGLPTARLLHRNFIACLCCNQNIDKAAALLRFTNS